MACDEEHSRLSVPSRIARFPIVVYRYTLAWFLGGHCRFTPTCSEYGLEAIRVHGAIKGWYLIMRRLLRCQPFCRGGYDPVPPPAGNPESVDKG